MFHSHHVDDIGRVLLQAQEDIAALRGRIGSGVATGAELDAVLTRAEADLRAKAELVLSAVTQNNAATLGPISEPSHDFSRYGGGGGGGGGGGSSSSDAYDRPAATPYHHYDEGDEYWNRGSTGGTRGSNDSGVTGYSTANSRPAASAMAAASSPQRRRQQHQQQPQQHQHQQQQPQSMSRARERVNDARSYEYMRNPTTVDARTYLRERFGIPYAPTNPLKHPRNRKKRGSDGMGQMLYKGPVTKPSGILPMRNRVDPAGELVVLLVLFVCLFSCKK